MKRPQILVLGSQGQLARSLAEQAEKHPDLDFTFTHRPSVDLESEGSLVQAIGGHSPDIVINAAAYTAVDRAETEPRLAAKINAEAPAVIAREAARVGARLIHISTDYVFDGRSPNPYSETAPTNPINVYGRTKWLGEEAIRSEHPDGHLIVRTSWVYSPFGNNFVKTMLRLAETRPEINVVADQVGTPTSALDLADGLIAAIGCWIDRPAPEQNGTFHLAGGGQTNWAALAEHVMRVSGARGGPRAGIVPITTAEYPTPAKRPSYSILDSAKYRSVFGYAPPPWQEGVREVVDRLLDREFAT